MEETKVQCKRCVLNSPDVSLDEEEICELCRKYENLSRKYIDIPEETKRKEFDLIVSKIKRYGKGRKYDCILGASGGCDSSYLAYLAVQEGLRPLIVHFDNSWNTDLAVKNIENIVEKLGLDLYTYVIDWEDFKDLQLAYIKASVVDMEVPTDYLIFAVLHKIAKKFGIKYVLSGYNYVTEFGLPKDWSFQVKFDHVNLSNIHKRFGNRKLKNFPVFGMYNRYWYTHILNIEKVELLNLVPFIKSDIKNLLSRELDWKDHTGKHHESIFTRFYQGYILPKKFNIDKREAHWSSMIRSGQATKEEALLDLANEPYSKELQNEDKEFFIKKFGITSEEFEKYMSEKPIPHSFYGLENPNSMQFRLYKSILKFPAMVSRKIKFMKATGKFRM